MPMRRAEVIQLSIAGARVKSVRSHLSAADLARLAATGERLAGPPPIPAAEPGAAIEVDRVCLSWIQRLTASVAKTVMCDSMESRLRWQIGQACRRLTS